MGFWKDVSELNHATRENLKQGHGRDSMRLATEQLKNRPPQMALRKRPSFKRIFTISALFGIFWELSRGRRRYVAKNAPTGVLLALGVIRRSESGMVIGKRWGRSATLG